MLPPPQVLPAPALVAGARRILCILVGWPSDFFCVIFWHVLQLFSYPVVDAGANGHQSISVA